MSLTADLIDIYRRLAAHRGPLGWWPAASPFEVCVGAILTQNTSWTGVEKAIANLRQHRLLTPRTLHGAEDALLAELIRPAGFCNVKSRRLRAFVSWLVTRHGGSLTRMFAGDWRQLRGELLALHGIGPETGDCILLYAGHRPSFVVDAYTRRLFSRLGLLDAGSGYEEIRALFMSALPADVPLYNDYHAQVVEQCKQVCRVRPRCRACCLADRCPSRHC